VQDIEILFIMTEIKYNIYKSCQSHIAYKNKCFI